MALERAFRPVRLFVAACGDLESARPWLENAFGPIVLESEKYELTQFTDYYVEEMGRAQKKQMLAFEKMIDPSTLPDIKLKTNNREREETPRRINLDPGYLSPEKVVLASAKNFAHRIALRDGIFAEVTLVYRKESSGYVPLEHTFPDYRSTGVLYFFNRLRELIR
jgi:hypothetical protein